MKVSYVEINEEKTYDLFGEGNMLDVEEKPQMKICSSIEDALQIKEEAEKYRLSQLI